jgi:hypothetical protein
MSTTFYSKSGQAEAAVMPVRVAQGKSKQKLTEVDRRFAALPRFFGVTRFAKGVSNLTQVPP